MRVLNLYAGIGGNRAGFPEGCAVTAVEFDPAIAEVYKEIFPHDTCVCGDAVAYLEQHYSEFDFIWASPPCQSHGQYRHNVGVIAKGYQPLVPDMTQLYGIIIFLRTYYAGLWCVENTIPYYTPLFNPVKLQRHLFWSNFPIRECDMEASRIRSKNAIDQFRDAALVKNSKIKNKRQVLRNMIEPELSDHIFSCMLDKYEELLLANE